LKFQRRPAKAVVVVVVDVGCGTEKGLRETTVFDREVELLGDTKADEHANRAVNARRMDLVVNIILFFFKLYNTSVVWYAMVSYRVVVVSCHSIIVIDPESSRRLFPAFSSHRLLSRALFFSE
jgi:hypothetical protein